LEKPPIKSAGFLIEIVHPDGGFVEKFTNGMQLQVGGVIEGFLKKSAPLP
jgi:hypothetical protein